MNPFKDIYGREANTIHEYTPGSNPTTSINSSLLEHQRIIDLLKNNLNHSHDKMIKQANKKRQDKQFKVGELVYLRLHNYRQHSVASRENQKLSKRFLDLTKYWNVLARSHIDFNYQQLLRYTQSSMFPC